MSPENEAIKRIVVVEPQPEVRKMLKIMVGSLGYKTYCRSNLGGALEILKKRKSATGNKRIRFVVFDCDFRRRHYDGVVGEEGEREDVRLGTLGAQKIKDVDKKVGIGIMTIRASILDNEEREKMRQAGVAFAIGKPIDITDLEKELSAYK